MPRRFLRLAQHAPTLAIQHLKHPLADLAVDKPAFVLELRVQDPEVLVQLAAGFGGFFVFFRDGAGFHERGQPGVLQEHGVGRAEFRDLVQTAGDEVAGRFAVAFGGEVGGFAVDDGLCWGCAVSERFYLAAF